MNVSSEAFRAAYAKLPFVIREFIMGDELGNILEGMGNTYGLHIDTIGAINNEVTNMLVGLESPAQFAAELKTMGVPETNINPIVQELNEKVFIPLRQKMQNGGDKDPHEEDGAIYEQVAKNLGLIDIPATNTTSIPIATPTQGVPMPPKIAPISYANPAPMPAPTTPVVPAFPTYAQAPIAPAPSLSQFNQPYPQAPAPIQTAAPVPQFTPAPQQVAQTIAAQIPAPVGQPAARPMPPAPANLPGTAPVVAPVSSIATAPIPATPPQPVAPSWIPQAPAPAASVPAPTPIQMPAMRTMSHDMDAVKSGTYPASQPAAPFVAGPVPVAQSVPKQQALSAPTMPVAAPMQIRTPAPAPLSAPQTPNEQELHETLKRYGIDPYREPVE